MTEHQIQQRILLLGRGKNRLWRNNVGTGWAGKSERVSQVNCYTLGRSLQPGDVVVRQARPLHAGLCQGSSDAIGFRSIEIGTQTIAQFVALEVKSAKGRPTEEQRHYLALVRQMGGIGEIVRSVEEAEQVLRGPPM
jgi:hypothetical protein